MMVFKIDRKEAEKLAGATPENISLCQEEMN